MQPRRLSQTAVLNITSNRTVSATATVQGLMDEEILVLDIDAYDSLFRQFLHTLGLDHKVLVVSLGIIALALSISVVFSSGMKGVKPYIGIQN